MKFDTRKYYLPFLLIAIVIIAFLIGRSCSSSPPRLVGVYTDSLRAGIMNQVAGMMARKQTVTTIVAYKDSIQHHWHTKYQEIRHDSLIPCPEKLAIADTVLAKDSSEIVSLSALVGIQDSIIVGQGKVIKADSGTILMLKKEIRRQKRHKVFLAAASILGLGLAITR